MNHRVKLLAAAVAVLLLAACGAAPAASSAAPSSSAPAQSSQAAVSESSQPESSSESSASTEPATPAVVETQTKQVEGFTSSVVDSGELYVNGIVLSPGGTIAEMQAKLEQTPDMGVYTDKGKAAYEEKMKKEDGMGASGDGSIVLDRTESSHLTVGVQYNWRNTGESVIKRINAKIVGFEANYETEEEVAEWNKISPTEVRQADLVLPNGWYLGGTVSMEDRMALTSTAPTTMVIDRYTWYTYPMGEAGYTLKLKFDTLSGVFSGVQIDYTKR